MTFLVFVILAPLAPVTSLAYGSGHLTSLLPEPVLSVHGVSQF